jgi:hypothetical protein
VLVQGKLKSMLEEDNYEKEREITEKKEEFQRKVDLRVKTQEKRKNEIKLKMT